MTYSAPFALAQPETDEATVFHFIKFHLGDWCGGTQGMSLEHEGAYLRFLVRLYQRGKPLPDDDRFMSTAMGLSLRIWRRVKEVLVEAGKIIIRAGSLTNSRFEKERARRAEEIKKKAEAAHNRHAREKVSGKFAPSLAETSTKLSEIASKKLNENNDAPANIHMLTSNQSQKEERTTPEARKRPSSREELDQLECDLLNACNGAAANPAAAPSLLQLSEPLRWIEQGCDLDADILPTVKARAAKAAKGSIRSWGYFTEAVAQAKANRLAPMPEAQATPASAPRLAPWEEEQKRKNAVRRAAREKISAEYQARQKDLVHG